MTSDAKCQIAILLLILLIAGCEEREPIEDMDDVYSMIAEEEGITKEALFEKYDSEKEEGVLGTSSTAEKMTPKEMHDHFWSDGRLSKNEFNVLAKENIVDPVLVDDSDGALFGSSFSGMPKSEYDTYWQNGYLSAGEFEDMYSRYDELKKEYAASNKLIDGDKNLFDYFWEDGYLTSSEFAELENTGIVENILVDETNGGLLGNSFPGIRRSEYSLYWSDGKLTAKEYSDLYARYKELKAEYDSIELSGEGLDIDVVE